MVTELRDLLHDAADAPRTDAVDTAALLSMARRRVTHRRRSGIAGLCVAVASVTLVAGVLTRSNPSPEPHPPTEPKPSTSTDNRLTQAPMAVAGRDYRVITSYDVRSLAGSTGRLAEAVTPDGLVVYRDGPDGGSSASEIGLLDPTTGDTRHLPTQIARIGANRIITDHDFIAGASYGVASAGIWFYNTATHAWTTFDIGDLVADGITGVDPTTAAVTRIQFGTDSADDLFVSIRPSDGRSTKSRVVSVQLDGTTGEDPAALDPVDHGDARLWAMAADTIASLNSRTAEEGAVTLRDLNTGDEQTVDIPGAGSCSVHRLWMRNDRIIAMQDCSSGADAYSQLQVFDWDGESVDVVRAPSFDVVSTANNLMMLRSQSPEGLFLYDLANGDLLRLTRHDSAFVDVVASERSSWVFSQPIQRGAGLKMWVADFSQE